MLTMSDVARMLNIEIDSVVSEKYVFELLKI